MKYNRTRLSIESLEDRLVPTNWGVAWPSSLTISFVPDGTQVGTRTSVTPQGVTASQWQSEILRAVQAWAAAAKIDVGVVADGGQPLGTAGTADGDSRFGDIRIAAVPLGTQSSVAIGAPYDPLAGTSSGDLIFNTSQPFSVGGVGGYDPFSVALHEVGHVLGFADTSDPTSVHYDQYVGVRSGLSPADVADVQALYGARVADPYEGNAGNGTFSTAKALGVPNIAADITALGDVDTYRYQVPFYANGPLKITVQAKGLSLLTAGLRVYDASQNQVASAVSVNPLDGTASVTISNASAGSVFYLQVSGARGDVFGVGGYRLKVDSGAISRVLIGALDTLLDGVNTTVYNDGHNIQTPSTARQLDTSWLSTLPGFNYAINATLSGPAAVNYYRLTVPAAAPKAIVFTATATRGSLLDPELAVYDAAGNVVPVEILSNDSGSYAVQVLNPTAGATYYAAVRSDAAAAGQSGTYLLGADYRSSAIVLDSLANNSLSATNAVAVKAIKTTQAMLYHFVLSSDSASAAPAGLAMQLFDQNNNLVLTLFSQKNQTVSVNVLLSAGTYHVRFVAATMAGMMLPAMSYALKGSRITDPLDPLPIDPTLPPPPGDMPPPPEEVPPVVVTPPVVELPPLMPIDFPWIGD